MTLRYAAFFMVLWVVQLASAQQQFQLCTYTDPTTGKSYDLTPLAQQFTTKSSASPPGHPPELFLLLHSLCESHRLTREAHEPLGPAQTLRTTSTTTRLVRT
jgi:hypothetical protein